MLEWKVKITRNSCNLPYGIGEWKKQGQVASSYIVSTNASWCLDRAWCDLSAHPDTRFIATSSIAESTDSTYNIQHGKMYRKKRRKGSRENVEQNRSPGSLSSQMLNNNRHVLQQSGRSDNHHQDFNHWTQTQRAWLTADYPSQLRPASLLLFARPPYMLCHCFRLYLRNIWSKGHLYGLKIETGSAGRFPVHL